MIFLAVLYLRGETGAQRPKGSAQLAGQKFGLFPGRVVATFLNLAVINEFVVCLFCPTPRGLIVLAGKYAHGGQDRDVGGIVEIEFKLPIEASRGDGRIRQPIEREVVKDVVSRGRRQPDRAK